MTTKAVYRLADRNRLPIAKFNGKLFVSRSRILNHFRGPSTRQPNDVRVRRAAHRAAAVDALVMGLMARRRSPKFLAT